jgi:hypothetical protein
VATNRVFFPQQIVDRWLADSVVGLEGEVLVVLPDGPAFLLTSAVRFGAEVGSGEDGPGLCGKVKTLQAIEALSGEYDLGSVVLGDYAYEVVDGFVGDLLEVANEGWGAPKPAESNPRSTHAGPPLRKSSGTSSQALRSVQSAKSGFSIPAVLSARESLSGGRASRPGALRPHDPDRGSSVSIAALTGASLSPGKDPPPAPALIGARSALVALAELVSRG